MRPVIQRRLVRVLVCVSPLRKGARCSLTSHERSDRPGRNNVRRRSAPARPVAALSSSGFAAVGKPHRSIHVSSASAQRQQQHGQTRSGCAHSPAEAQRLEHTLQAVLSLPPFVTVFSIVRSDEAFFAPPLPLLLIHGIVDNKETCCSVDCICRPIIQARPNMTLRPALPSALPVEALLRARRANDELALRAAGEELLTRLRRDRVVRLRTDDATASAVAKCYAALPAFFARPRHVKARLHCEIGARPGDRSYAGMGEDCGREWLQLRRHYLDGTRDDGSDGVCLPGGVPKSFEGAFEHLREAWRRRACTPSRWRWTPRPTPGSRSAISISSLAAVRLLHHRSTRQPPPPPPPSPPPSSPPPLRRCGGGCRDDGGGGAAVPRRRTVRPPPLPLPSGWPGHRLPRPFRSRPAHTLAKPLVPRSARLRPGGARVARGRATHAARRADPLWRRAAGLSLRRAHPAPLHRVPAPPKEAGTRYSMPFFARCHPEVTLLPRRSGAAATSAAASAAVGQHRDHPSPRAGEQGVPCAHFVVKQLFRRRPWRQKKAEDVDDRNGEAPDY